MGRSSSKAPHRRKRGRRSKSGSAAKGEGGLDGYVMKYRRLMDVHLKARTEYFRFFHQANPKRLAKLERNFSSSMDDVRRFEKAIPDPFRDGFRRAIDGAPPDLTYSQNRGLTGEGDGPPVGGVFDDPHLKASQKGRSYADDLEEGEGSMEDYRRIKGAVS